MKRAKLAFNRWRMGQVLMPQHFETLQDALLQHVAMRIELQGLPAYGLAELEWDEAQLEKGALAISKIAIVFESGELIAAPGNATVSNLNIASSPEASHYIYVHILNEASDSKGLLLYEDDPDHVTRVVYRLSLSTRQSMEHAGASLPLAMLVRQDGAWTLGDYIPPLLQVGTSPFLQRLIADKRNRLEQLELMLDEALSDSFLGSDQIARLRRCRAASYRLRACLLDLSGQVHLHPYVLFTAFRDFYVELCLFQNTDPEREPATYDHDDLATTFGRLQRQIDQRLQLSPVKSPHLPFVQTGHHFLARPFPQPLAAAREVYLVIQRPMDIEVSLQGIKLASPSRLEHVHINALPGVPWRPIRSPGFFHTFGPNSDFYRLEPNDEWQQAVREGALCFYARPHLTSAAIRAALSWRA